MRVADPAQAWFEAAIAAFDLGMDPTVVAVSLAAAVLALALWVAWRRPALMLAPGLAALALRPQLLWGDRNVGYQWGLHQTLLVVGLAVNALHFGVRKSINWPILALSIVFALNLLFGHLHDDLTTGLMLTGWALLALPFAFTHVILAPDARGVCTLVIALTPLLSVAIGALMQAAGIHTMFADVHDRLEGATGNAGVFGALAFAGFAVALHELAVRPKGRSWTGALASVNLVLVILSGTRTSMLASAVLLIAYVLTSEQFRERLRRSRAMVLFGICLIGAAVTFYAPTLYTRVLDSLGRSGIWQRFYDEFWRSPIFGRGIGSAFITRKPLELLYAAPHNEYLHLLVIGGALGFVLCTAAITLWYSDVLRNASPNDRKFLLSVAAALAIYALADNILVYPTALGLFVYLGVIGQPKDASSAIAIAVGRGAGAAPQANAHSGAERGVASLRRWTVAPFRSLGAPSLQACLAYVMSRRVGSCANSSDMAPRR
jgi:teichuronic acid biosynthesis protein TuaE